MPQLAGLYTSLTGENARPDISTNIGVSYAWRWDGDVSDYGSTSGSSSFFTVPGLYLATVYFSGVIKLPWPGTYTVSAGSYLIHTGAPKLYIGEYIDSAPMTAPGGAPGDPGLTTPDNPWTVPVKLVGQALLRIGDWWPTAQAPYVQQPPFFVTDTTTEDAPVGIPGGGELRAWVNLDYSFTMRNEMDAAYGSSGGLSFHCFEQDAVGQRLTVISYAAATSAPPSPPPPPPPPGVIAAGDQRSGVRQGRKTVAGRTTAVDPAPASPGPGWGGSGT